MTNDFAWYAKYEKGVPKTVEVPDKPLFELVTESAKRFPNNVAARMVLRYLPLGLAIQSRLSYSELDSMTDRFAAALQELGIKQGDRVAIMLPNTPQTLIAYFGILKAGATVVNINPTYPAPEIKHVLADCGAIAIVLLSGLVERVQQIREHTTIKHLIFTDVPDSLSWPFNNLVAKQVRASGLMKDLAPAPDLHNFYGIIKQAPSKPSPVKMSADDVVLFQYTGGTTGVPKAAMLTHRNLVANCLQMNAWFTKVEYGREKVLFALPSFHVYGMTVAMLFGFASGAELVLVPDPRNTGHILEVIAKEKITMYPGVPAMYIGIINHPKVSEYNLHSIKACLSGGSALPVEVAQKFEQITGGKLVEGFGMTESSPVATANPIYGEVRTGSIGLPISSTVCAVCSLEPDENGNFKILDQGAEGELIVKGPQVMKGYWGMPDETAKTIDKDGWLHTGDIAKMDADGYFYIVDRKKDLIIASGFNIVPREVEEVLFQHPKVLEAAVAGVPDAKRGETVKAYVVLKEGVSCTEAEIRDFCKEHLAPYKVPSAVQFRKDLPKTQVGKVLRRMLVEEEKQKQAK
jgi:long-chain acyl-CoA synthetase